MQNDVQVREKVKQNQSFLALDAIDLILFLSVPALESIFCDLEILSEKIWNISSKLPKNDSYSWNFEQIAVKKSAPRRSTSKKVKLRGASKKKLNSASAHLFAEVYQGLLNPTFRLEFSFDFWVGSGRLEFKECNFISPKRQWFWVMPDHHSHANRFEIDRDLL